MITVKVTQIVLVLQAQMHMFYAQRPISDCVDKQYYIKKRVVHCSLHRCGIVPWEKELTVGVILFRIERWRAVSQGLCTAGRKLPCEPVTEWRGGTA